MSDKFRFGNGTCPSIEVDPFRPICRKPGIDPSEAMSLEVPVPMFAPVVTPQECVCFTFAKGEAETVVKTHKVTAKSPLPKSKVTVEIDPSSDDCCNGGYTITPHIEIYIPDLSSPEVCLADSEVTVKVTYPDPDAEGGKNTVTSTGGKATGGNAGKCLKYTFGTLEIDLSGMPTGAFGNGGSVFKASDGDLYIDGTIDLEKDIWFGGGLGNLATDDPNAVICRGPLMMGLTSQEYEAIAGSGNHLVPHDDTKQFRLAKVGATSSSGTAIAWHSSRKTETTNEDTTTVGVNNNDTITETDMTGGTNQSVTYVGGNLSMVMPTGFQWHKRGLALNLSHFFWNDSGLLSILEEEPYAALVSPAPRTFKSSASSYEPSPTSTAVARANANASGLAIDKPERDATYDMEPGLYIDGGNGLRIFGVDAKTTSSGATEDWSTNRLGKLEVYGHSGDFLFNWDGKMVLNDKKAPAAPFSSITGEEILAYPGYGSSGQDIPSWGRNTDCTVPVVVPQYDLGATGTTGTYWAVNNYGSWQVRIGPAKADIDNADAALKKSDGTYITHGDGSSAVHAAALNSLQKVVDALYKLLYTLGTLHMVPMHFSRSGNLMAIDKNEDSQAVTRHYQATQPGS